VEYRGHRTRECENWSVDVRLVKDINDEANATARDVSDVKTIAISHKNRNLNRNESAVCGWQPKIFIIIARPCVNGYSIITAPEKGVTHVSF
jgi:hypothetical protein